MRPGTLRPLVHAGMLAFVFLTPVLGKWGMAGVAAAAHLGNLLVLPRTALGRAMAREGEGRWNGLVSYPLAVALCFVLFPPEAAAAAWAILATGDAAAALVGRAAGGCPIPWNRRKTAAGLAAFVAAGTVLSTVVLILAFRPDAEGASGIALGCLLGTGVAAFVETLPLPLDDNLPVALAAAAVFHWTPAIAGWFAG